MAISRYFAASDAWRRLVIDGQKVGRSLMLAAAGFAGGAVLGVAAWGQGRVPVLALLLPVESQEVVHTANAGDGRLVIQG